MIKEGILHIPMSEYVFGTDEEHIVYRLRTKRNDIKKVTLYYGDTACRVTPIIFTPVNMKIAASDGLFDYWEIEVLSPYNRVYYYFEISDGKESTLYYGHLFTDELVDDRSQYFKLPFNHRADIVKVPDWVKDSVVYNIFPDSFATSKEWISKETVIKEYEGNEVKGKLGGTLSGIAENVEYLKELGINCVYVNPIFVAGEYHKYDLLDYYHVDPCFGGDEAFEKMVDALHENGIKIIIDGVFNHCGWKFFAFEDVVKNQERSEYKDWFYHLEFPVIRPDNPKDYPTYACFAYERMMPKLDTANPKVRKYFCDVGRYWVKRFKIDGWRLDVASEVDDRFWREFRIAVKEENEAAILIGEVWESANHWLLGDMFDSAMNYDFRKHGDLFFAKGVISSAEFAGRITHMLMRYRKQTTFAQLNLLDSHDVGRFLSLCGGDKKRYCLSIVFMMTFVGMPTIFYGDELGMVGELEEEYRRPMPWGKGDRQLFEFFKNAISMRHKLSALKRGSYKLLYCGERDRLLGFVREYEGQRVSVWLNADDKTLKIKGNDGRLYWQKGLEKDELEAFGFAIFVDE